jgi:hypothetical protein
VCVFHPSSFPSLPLLPPSFPHSPTSFPTSLPAHPSSCGVSLSLHPPIVPFPEPLLHLFVSESSFCLLLCPYPHLPFPLALRARNCCLCFDLFDVALPPLTNAISRLLHGTFASQLLQVCWSHQLALVVLARWVLGSLDEFGNHHQTLPSRHFSLLARRAFQSLATSVKMMNVSR